MQDLKAVRKFVEEAGGDGHTIFLPSFFVKMGFEESFVLKHTRQYESDGSTKGSISKDGKILENVHGVYGLFFAYAVAADIGADPTEAHSKMGRGSQAGELAVAISNKLKELGA
jgi:hypothetical protein